MAPLEKMGDTQLLEATAAGSEKAFRLLFDRHAREMRRRAYDVLHSEPHAEDAVQEAFLDLWRTAARFDPERAAVRTWLCVLVHRRAVDLARREARRGRNGEGSAPHSLSYTAEEALLLRLERREVQAALARLTQKSREILELAYYGGLTHSQLADRFQLPLGTVKSRMRQALGDLAAALSVSPSSAGLAEA